MVLTEANEGALTKSTLTAHTETQVWMNPSITTVIHTEKARGEPL